MRRSPLLLGLAAWAAAPLVQAHSFGRLYNLPVPFWLYAWGAAAALLLSFLVAGYFLKAPAAPALPARPAPSWAIPLWLIRSLQGASAAALGLCIITGLWGHPDAYANVNMTLFWIGFVLAFAWAVALVGNWYALLNPWQLLAAGLGKCWRGYAQGAYRYPAHWGVWPALLLYMGFIGVELFARIQPQGLAWLLLGYSALNLLGAGLWGMRAWFYYCEFFSVFLRLLALMAPVQLQQGRVQLRPPFAGLLQQQASSYGELLFVLFMLSSTAFDGLRETVPFAQLYWSKLYLALQPWLPSNPFAAYPLLRPWYPLWQAAWLLASPLVYWAIYMGFIALSRAVAGSPLPLRTVALRFAYTLLPIALVYHLTHYWTLLLTQGLQVFPLLSDPLGTGADYLGTRQWFNAAVIPDMGMVWHTQVGLIVLGHGVSVVVAHLVALRSFTSPISGPASGRHAATLSQLPMLVLMMLFTAAGLWVLAQPLQAGL